MIAREYCHWAAKQAREFAVRCGIHKGSEHLSLICFHSKRQYSSWGRSGSGFSSTSSSCDQKYKEWHCPLAVPRFSRPLLRWRTSIVYHSRVAHDTFPSKDTYSEQYNTYLLSFCTQSATWKSSGTTILAYACLERLTHRSRRVHLQAYLSTSPNSSRSNALDDYGEAGKEVETCSRKAIYLSKFMGKSWVSNLTTDMS